MLEKIKESKRIKECNFLGNTLLIEATKKESRDSFPPALRINIFLHHTIVQHYQSFSLCSSISSKY